MTAIACPTCGTKLDAPSSMAGRKVQCGGCKALFVIPTTALAAIDNSAPLQVALVEKSANSLQAVGDKECPFCGERILVKAKKCKHCGETIDIALRAAEEARRTAELNARSSGGSAAASSNTTVVVHGDRRQFPHFRHFLMTFITCGAWLPIWILAYLFRSK